MELTPSDEEKTMAMLCHLASFAGYFVPIVGNIVGPLIVWQLKKEGSAFIDHHGREAVNFQLNICVYLTILLPLCLFLVGIPFAIAVTLASLVLTIVAAVKARDGESYRYPFTIRLV